MQNISTRGGCAPVPFSRTLLGGLAPDGGLFLPEAYPRVTDEDLARWRSLDYPGLAFEIVRRFATDIPEEDLRALVSRTYTAGTFGSPDIVPLRTLEPGLHILGLSNGPTLAFKDIALQLLGNLFEYALARSGEELNILGATSGDTGSSAEYAMRGKKGIRVFMLSPHGRMSAFQRAQMYSLADPNIFNLAIESMFDDCQNIVKAVSNDRAFKEKYRIGTVNSINWSRLMAQVVYYFKGYFAATRSNDEQVSFAVPSGNFGNICAGHVARCMGLPIRRLVLATNENDVLDEFFRTGVYKPRSAGDTFATSSPSMDISKASNFERFVFDLVGRDAALVKALWAEVDAGRPFDLSGTPHFARIADFGFVSGKSTHADRLETIRRIWGRHGVEIDTHTADGIKVGLQHREAGVPLVCLETALPVKFEDTILEALGRKPACPARFQDLERRPQHFTVLPPAVDRVKAFIEAHA
ncbi:MAG TPA: threonine synthase [Holophaga sp.]|nr:threonine synthase [Holophaga sp.]HPS66474.1 threonine synthase [Holophaga sp.]